MCVFFFFGGGGGVELRVVCIEDCNGIEKLDYAICCSPPTRMEVFVKMELHPSLASVLMDFQENYVNGSDLFVVIV